MVVKEGMPYNFQYGVKDDYSGNDFGQSEQSDGDTVSGSYTVQLPDGHIQMINYAAEDDNGYKAEVRYEGEAQYPHEYGPAITFKLQNQPSFYPEPLYKPQPLIPAPAPHTSPSPHTSPQLSYKPGPHSEESN
nr:cuticle protein 7-like [Procambarus clarkii]